MCTFVATGCCAAAACTVISIANNHPFPVTTPITLHVADDAPIAPGLVTEKGRHIATQLDTLEMGGKELSFVIDMPASETVLLRPTWAPVASIGNISRVSPALPEFLIYEGPAAKYVDLAAVTKKAEPLALRLTQLSAGPVRSVYKAESFWRSYRIYGHVYAYVSGPTDIELAVEQLGESRTDTYLTIVKRLPKRATDSVWTRYKGVATAVPSGWQPLARRNRMESWSRDSQWVYIDREGRPGQALLFAYTPSFTVLNEKTRQHLIANDFLVNERVVNQPDAVYVFSDLTGANELSYVTASFVTPPKGWRSLLRWRYQPEVEIAAVDRQFIVYAGYRREETAATGPTLKLGVESVVFGSSHYPHAFLAEDFLYWRTNGPFNLYTYLGEKWSEFKPEIDRDFKIMNALGLECLGMAPMFERIFRYSTPEGMYLQPPQANLPVHFRKKAEELQEPGRWCLEFLDYASALARKYGLKFVLDARISPSDAAYLVERHKDVISHYEVENETLLLNGVPVDRIDYWRSLYESIKKANPEVKVFWNGGPSFQAAFEKLTDLGIGFDAVGVHEYVDRRESPDYVKDTALAHGAYAAQQKKDALIGEFNWRYLARESEEAQADHFFAISDALLSQRSIDVFMQYKFSDTCTIEPEHQKGIRHYELLRLDRTLKPQGEKYVELIRKYGDKNAPVNVLRIDIPETPISPDAWSTLVATVRNCGAEPLSIPLVWDLPPEVELAGDLPSPLQLAPGAIAALTAQVKLRAGSRPGYYHLFLATEVNGRAFFGWSTVAFKAQPLVDTQTPPFAGVAYTTGIDAINSIDFTLPGTVVLGDATEELEWSYALYNTLRSATGNAIDRADAADLAGRTQGNLFVVGNSQGLAKRLLPADAGVQHTYDSIVYIGPNLENPASRVVVFLGANTGKAVSDFIYRYWKHAKDAVTFDDRMDPPIVDQAVVRLDTVS